MEDIKSLFNKLDRDVYRSTKNEDVKSKDRYYVRLYECFGKSKADMKLINDTIWWLTKADLPQDKMETYCQALINADFLAKDGELKKFTPISMLGNYLKKSDKWNGNHQLDTCIKEYIINEIEQYKTLDGSTEDKIDKLTNELSEKAIHNSMGLVPGVKEYYIKNYKNVHKKDKNDCSAIPKDKVTQINSIFEDPCPHNHSKNNMEDPAQLNEADYTQQKSIRLWGIFTIVQAVVMIFFIFVIIVNGGKEDHNGIEPPFPTEESPTEESSTEESPTEEPATEESSTGESPTEEASTEESTAAESKEDNNSDHMPLNTENSPERNPYTGTTIADESADSKTGLNRKGSIISRTDLYKDSLMTEPVMNDGMKETLIKGTEVEILSETDEVYCISCETGGRKYSNVYVPILKVKLID